MGQVHCPNRRSLHLRIDIAFEPEAEPAPATRPASAQEGTSAEPAIVESDSDGWDVLPIGALPPTGSVTRVTQGSPNVLVRRSRHREPGLPRFAPASQLLEPEEWLPSRADLFSPRVRVYVVWSVPGRPEWRGIHYGKGTLAWRQIRSWACSAVPGQRPETVFACIRWQRCWGCDHDQLIRVLFRESESSAAYSGFRWTR